MRVVMVNGTYGGVSGSGRAVKTLSEELVKNGLEVHLCTNETVGYVKIPKLKSLSFAVLAKLRSEFKCDVIHVHNPKFAVVAKGGFPNVMTVHGDYLAEFSLKYGKVITKIFDAWFGLQLQKFRCVTCVSPYWSRLRGWRYVPNGLDLERLRRIKPSGERCVLFVGRKDRIKGWDLFEGAMAKLPYKYRMLGVYERAPWDQVIAYMKSAYCLVLPSMQEGMPYVVLEAWASGCPVIATDLPSLRSFGEGAIYFLEERSAESIRRAVRNVVEDESLAEGLRRSGLEKAEAFDIRSVAKEYISVYEEAVRCC
jgi:glycosyltransferase involved in cell wall biosynthesis